MPPCSGATFEEISVFTPKPLVFTLLYFGYLSSTTIAHADAPYLPVEGCADYTQAVKGVSKTHQKLENILKIGVKVAPGTAAISGYLAEVEIRKNALKQITQVMENNTLHKKNLGESLLKQLKDHFSDIDGDEIFENAHPHTPASRTAESLMAKKFELQTEIRELDATVHKEKAQTSYTKKLKNQIVQNKRKIIEINQQLSKMASPDINIAKAHFDRERLHAVLSQSKSHAARHSAQTAEEMRLLQQSIKLNEPVNPLKVETTAGKTMSKLSKNAIKKMARSRAWLRGGLVGIGIEIAASVFIGDKKTAHSDDEEVIALLNRDPSLILEPEAIPFRERKDLGVAAICRVAKLYPEEWKKIQSKLEAQMNWNFMKSISKINGCPDGYDSKKYTEAWAAKEYPDYPLSAQKKQLEIARSLDLSCVPEWARNALNESSNSPLTQNQNIAEPTSLKANINKSTKFGIPNQSPYKYNFPLSPEVSPEVSSEASSGASTAEEKAKP